MGLSNTREYYLVFVSIVFGIFITAWAEPIVERYKDSPRTEAEEAVAIALDQLSEKELGGQKRDELCSKLLEALPVRIQVEDQVTTAVNTTLTGLASTLTTRVSDKLSQAIQENVRSFFHPARRSPTLRVIRGILTLLVIVSLWWWYGIFIRWFAPAQGFLMYLYDFASLGAFAVATGLWTSDTGAFQTIVPIASALIFVRFLSLRRATKKAELARSAVDWALVILSIIIATHVIFSLGILWGRSDDEALLPVLSRAMEVITPILMCLSIGVTFFAVYRTEGLGWGRFFLPYSFEMQDRLLDPLGSLGHEPLGKTVPAALNLRERALCEFQHECADQGLSTVSAYMASVVHSVNDLHAQVSLAVYAGDGSNEDAVQRAKLMYFVHWLDDVFDQKKGLAAKLCEVGPTHLDAVLKTLPRHKKLADSFKESFQQPVFFETGVMRLAYGGLLFKGTSKTTDIRNKHRDLLIKRGVDEKYFSNEHSRFVDLSVKTVTEFWFGLESDPPFDYSFLFSLLYGPGLYYHNVDEERRAQEHSSTWGVFSDGEAAAFVSQVGEDLRGRLANDARKEGRVLEVRAFVDCFSNVLPATVKDAYDAVTEALLREVGADPHPPG